MRSGVIKFVTGRCSEGCMGGPYDGHHGQCPNAPERTLPCGCAPDTSDICEQCCHHTNGHDKHMQCNDCDADITQTIIERAEFAADLKEGR